MTIHSLHVMWCIILPISSMQIMQLVAYEEELARLMVPTFQDCKAHSVFTQAQALDYLGAWAHGRMGTWTHGCTGAWVHASAGHGLLRYMGA